MPKTPTIFQKLSNILSNSNDIQTAVKKVNSYGIDGSDILFRTKDKGEYDAKVLQMKQQHLLAKQWKRANYELTNKSLAGLTEVKMMYRDADLMDCFPEIGTALDIMSEEACLYSDTEIKLTNGEIHTIGELFIKNYTNFEIYAVNDEGVCEKSKVEGVIYRGEKPLFELVLDDKTSIKCTEDHKWLTVNKEWKETKDLERGDELMSVYEQIDGFGNETLKSTTELSGKYHVHKVTSIEKLRMTGNVYDFVNSSVNKCFAVKCKQGHIISHNCFIPKNGFMVNVTSKSERVKSILQDLLVNRLQINVMLPMICRSMCKYGNTFLLLDINNENGVTNWRQLPVYEIERYENGMENPYAGAYVNLNNIDLNQTDSTKFVWVGQSEFIPYRNWQIAHFRLLYDSLLLPYGCLVGDTRIETEYGYKEMSNIKIGDKVWTFNTDTQKRELSEVTMFMPKGEKDVYNVSTKHYSVEGTLDHKLLSYCNGKLEYKEIGEIQKGDFVVCRNGSKQEAHTIHSDKSELKPHEHGKKSLKWWNDYISIIPEDVDEDFARLFGFLMGDGWLSHGYHVMFALGEYRSINERYIYLLEKFSGKKVSFVRNTNKKRKLPYHTAYVGSKMLLTILKRMGFNGDCTTKRIPEWVFDATYTIRKAFLDGIIDADGSLKITDGGKMAYNIELANEQLIKDIKILSISLGYKTGKIGHRNRIGYTSTSIGLKPIITTHESFYFNFYEELNEEYKNAKKIEWKEEGFMLEKVKSVTAIGKKQTYDFTVKSDNSNFFANGIVTHNCSILNKARRHWRMLSLMEDMMIIYRLERSIERRVFKINVGTIDDADVPAYVEEIANNFKRTPIIDPMTGQLDLKKNILNVSEDFFIPVRDDNASNPIDTLQGAQNMTAMDDIKFVQNKVFTALRVPKSFLNFEETTGDGKNLSLLDVRFTRTVNRMQQALLMELNKICIIHLYLLGFEDELTNFNLTMNNPSSQAEMLELENMAKKVTTAKDAISDAGNGIQLMSWTRACKEIMGWSDKEIEENLQEIRLEKALAAELEKTAQIIKRTKIFDKVDNIYGEAGAEYSEGIPQEGEEGGGMPGGGGGFGGDAIGSEDFDFGGGEEGEEMGSEGEMNMNMAAGEEAASTGGEGEGAGGGEGEPQTFGESYMNGMLKNLINEQRDIQKDIVRKSKNYAKRLNERRIKYENKNRVDENVPIYQKNFLINEDLDTMIKQLDTFGIGG